MYLCNEDHFFQLENAYFKLYEVFKQDWFNIKTSVGLSRRWSWSRNFSVLFFSQIEYE